MCVSNLKSLLFFIVCLTVNTLSMHDLPLLNPFCSSSNIASDIVLKRCTYNYLGVYLVTTVQKTNTSVIRTVITFTFFK
jgi:hypothetical protein